MIAVVLDGLFECRSSAGTALLYPSGLFSAMPARASNAGTITGSATHHPAACGWPLCAVSGRSPDERSRPGGPIVVIRQCSADHPDRQPVVTRADHGIIRPESPKRMFWRSAKRSFSKSRRNASANPRRLRWQSLFWLRTMRRTSPASNSPSMADVRSFDRTA